MRGLTGTHPLIYLFCFGLIAPVLSGSVADFQERIYDVFEENEGAVVRIKAAILVDDESLDEPKVTLRVGTGFFISREGHILANASVVHQAQRVWFEHDSVAFAAEKVGTDLGTNVALLRAVSLPPEFHYIPLSESIGISRIGLQVMSISYTLDFSPAPGLGMVTGHESSFGPRVFPTTYMRTSIPAYPGEGGAPVFDLNGRLIGMKVASLPEIGSSYVIPTNAAVRIRDDLLFSGEVRYAWLGIEVSEKADSQLGRWVEVDTVAAEGPADQAGMKEGDKMISVGEFPINRINDLREASFFSRVGQFVDIRVKREGEELRLSLRLVARPDDDEEDEEDLRLPPTPEVIPE